MTTPTLRAIERTIVGCPGRDALFILADHLDEATREMAAAGDDAAPVRRLVRLARLHADTLEITP